MKNHIPVKWTSGWTKEERDSARTNGCRITDGWLLPDGTVRIARAELFDKPFELEEFTPSENEGEGGAGAEAPAAASSQP